MWADFPEFPPCSFQQGRAEGRGQAEDCAECIICPIPKPQTHVGALSSLCTGTRAGQRAGAEGRDAKKVMTSLNF